jgi:L-amino acid N-acyltransferase YncA
MENARLLLRNATPADTTEIVALLNLGFRTPMDAATWEWYVYGNPLGHSQIYVAAEPDGALAGVIGFAPISLRIDGIAVRADFAHHLVLRPAYRDTLSFVALNRHALRAQAALGVRIAIGPPNRTAYPIHKTIMKWVDFGFLELIRKLEPTARPHACRECSQFAPSFDRFYERVSREAAFCLEKDHVWMNWRFLQRPGAPYTVYITEEGGELTGYVVLKRWREPDGYKKVHVMDLHALDDESLARLLAAADTYADGSDELNLWAVQGYPYRGALEGHGLTSAARQPLIARSYDGSTQRYPGGACFLSYGDGDTLY